MTVHPICQSVFEKAFPASADAEVVRAVTEGVLLADDLIHNDVLWTTKSGYGGFAHGRPGNPRDP